MKKIHSFWNILGGVIFTTGFLLGMAFIALTVWSDLEGNAFWGLTEAATYDSQVEMDARLISLTCPLVLTSQETGTVVARLKNPLTEPIDVTLQTDFSNPANSLEALQDHQQFQLAPQEQREFQWTVGMENLKFDRLILVRTYLIDPILRVPVRTAHCGILVVDTNVLPSNQIILISIVTSLSMMVVGTGLWVVGKFPLKNRRSTFSMIALAILTFFGIIASLAGAWILAGGFFILNLIILLTLFENTFQGQYVL